MSDSASSCLGAGLIVTHDQLFVQTQEIVGCKKHGEKSGKFCDVCGKPTDTVILEQMKDTLSERAKDFWNAEDRAYGEAKLEDCFQWRTLSNEWNYKGPQKYFLGIEIKSLWDLGSSVYQDIPFEDVNIALTKATELLVKDFKLGPAKLYLMIQW